MPSRRTFIKDSSRLFAGASLLSAINQPFTILPGRKLAPSDTVVVGLIGCRGMGFGNLRNHLRQDGIRCGGLCDVDDEILQRRANDVEAMTGERPRLYKDFRELLDQSDVDAIIIGTPDHWHCLQTVMACQAGKDVYVEKPMANSIAECELMVRAARHYDRVVQVGQQQRSGKHWQDVVAFVQGGELGRIRTVNVWGNFDYGKGLPRIPDSLPPAGFDYDLYLGPAHDQPYNENRIHGGWRHQWSFGGGLLSDWGVHLLDIVLWAMNIDGPPRSVSAAGGIYAYQDRAIETPDTLHVIYEMDQYTINWDHTAGIEQGPYGRNYGMAFIGDNGTLVANRAGWEVMPVVEDGDYKIKGLPLQRGQQSNHVRHATNFIQAVSEHTDPICTVEDGFMAAYYAHLGNIALRSGSRLEWSEGDYEFRGNEKALALVQPEYRAPWKWPEF